MATRITHHCSACGEYPDGNNLCHPTAIVATIISHGGRRRGAGRPPKHGAPQSERIGLTLTKSERAEIEAAVPDGSPVGRWIVKAALLVARGALD